MDEPASLTTKPNIPFTQQTIEQLWEERAYWQSKIDEATGWGAAVGAAMEFRNAITRELSRRNPTS